MYNVELKGNSANSSSKKYWGVWLPVPTIIAIINSIFWSWVISKAVGNNEEPTIEKSLESIIQQF